MPIQLCIYSNKPISINKYSLLSSYSRTLCSILSANLRSTEISTNFIIILTSLSLSLSLSSCARDGDTAGKSNQYNAHDRGPIPSQGGGREERRWRTSYRSINRLFRRGVDNGCHRIVVENESVTGQQSPDPLMVHLVMTTSKETSLH